MSFIIPASSTCPTCGAQARVAFPASINADRRPDLRAAILDGSCATQHCRTCGESLTFQPQLTYLDTGRRQWIFAEAAEARGDWPEIEAQAAEIFNDAFGGGAPEAARAIGTNLVPRLVFGWPALAEKLLCAELGLDDRTLEAVKIALIADGKCPSVYTTLDLRLTGADDENLVLDWLDPATGTAVERLRVPQAAYVLAKAGGDAWAPLIDRLAGPFFVDIGRVLHAPVGAQEAA
jgi:hypothetical protein